MEAGSSFQQDPGAMEDGLTQEVIDVCRIRERILSPNNDLFVKGELKGFADTWIHQWHTDAKVREMLWNPNVAHLLFQSNHSTSLVGGITMVVAHGGFLDDSGVLQHAAVWCNRSKKMTQPVHLNDTDIHYGYTIERDGMDVSFVANLRHYISAGPKDAANWRMSRTVFPGVSVAFSEMSEFKTWMALATFINTGIWTATGYTIMFNPADQSTRVVTFSYPTQSWSGVQDIPQDPFRYKMDNFIAGKHSEVAVRGDQYHARSRKKAADEDTSKKSSSILGMGASGVLLTCNATGGDVSGDGAWAIKLEKLHKDQPVLTLKEALYPTFALLRSRMPSEYQSFSDDDFFQIIDNSVLKMRALLTKLNISGEYDAEMAAGINIFTKESPPWYSIMSTSFNDVNRRTSFNDVNSDGASRVSNEVAACLPYSKFLLNALEHLPCQYHHTGSAVRGVNWVYPSPLNHDPEWHFPNGSHTNMYSWKSFSTDVSMVQKEEQFCGQLGLRTLFKMEAGLTSYKISDFSDFPGESEVLIPILSRFIVKSVVKLITVKLDGGETESTVYDPAFLKSPDHSGNPDIVVLQPVQDS